MATKEFEAPIKATERSFAIIEEIRRRDGARLTELADHFGMSKSTIHEHLATLVEAQYLRRDGDEYSIGLKFLTLGGHARQQQEFYDVVRTEVDELVEETGEAAKFAVEEYGRGIYLYQSRGEKAVQTDSHVGTRVYLHSSALGKTMLAHLPDQRVDEIITEWGLPGRTEYTITDEDELYDELSHIRNRGYAIDNEERILGLKCVAAPVKRNDELLGAISVSGPTKRFADDEVINELADLVQNTARVIEINAKYM